MDLLTTLSTMNNHHIISLALIIFFAFSNPFSAAQPVLDSDGDPLQPGAEYYAKYFSSSGGGPTLGEYGCPKLVIHDPESDGLPVAIHPKAGSDIVEFSDVYIEFTEGIGADCPFYNTTIWRINRGLGGTIEITVGGDFEGGEYASFSNFQIVKSGSAYKIARSASSYIINRGIYLGTNGRLDDPPYQVVFVKKSSANVIQLPK